MVPEWQIQFGPELDDEIEFFDNAAQAVEFINNADCGSQAYAEDKAAALAQQLHLQH